MRNTKTAALVLTALFAAIIVIMAYTPLGYIPLGIINATIIQIPVILGSLFCGPKKGGFLGFIFGLTSFLKNTLTPATASAFVFSPVLASSVIGPSGIFKSAFICFVPRILVGVVPYFVYIGVRKLIQGNSSKVWASVLNVIIGLFLFAGVRAFVLRSYPEQTVMAIVIAVVTALVIAVVLEVVSLKISGASVSFVYSAIAGAMTNTLLVMFGIFFLYKEAYAEAIGKEASEVLSVITGVISFNGVIEAIVSGIIVTALGLVLVRMKPIGKTEE